MFKCPICGNEDPLYLGVRNNETYCRKCIKFSKVNYEFNKSLLLTDKGAVEKDYYNNLYIKDLINKGYMPYSDKDSLLLDKVLKYFDHYLYKYHL